MAFAETDRCTKCHCKVGPSGAGSAVVGRRVMTHPSHRRSPVEPPRTPCSRSPAPVRPPLVSVRGPARQSGFPGDQRVTNTKANAGTEIFRQCRLRSASQMTQNLTGSSVCSTTLSAEDSRSKFQKVWEPGAPPCTPHKCSETLLQPRPTPNSTSQWHQVACAPGLWVCPHPLMERASCPLPKLTPSHALEFRSEAYPDPRGRIKQGLVELAPSRASTAHTAAGQNSGLHAAVEGSPHSG